MLKHSASLMAEMVGFAPPAGGPGRSSDSPPGCHSVLLPFEPHTNVLQMKKRGTMPKHCTSLMAEMVGFEPTCHFTDKTISSRSRYDHFDTSPYKAV